MRLVERIIEKPRACSYLSGERASLEVRVMLDVEPDEMDALLERGWRRFGPFYFRPACNACAKCVSLRVPTETFSPSKSQRRAARACSRLRREVGAPQVDDDRLALYAEWHASRETARGWEPNPQERTRYALELAFPHPCAREAAFYDDEAGERLVGVGLFDETPRAISAAFFFYDPDYSRLSIGTANVLSLIDDARSTGRAHAYLGYCVEGCASLSYKASFRPNELLYDRPAHDDRPSWRPASRGLAGERD